MKTLGILVIIACTFILMLRIISKVEDKFQEQIKIMKIEYLSQADNTTERLNKLGNMTTYNRELFDEVSQKNDIAIFTDLRSLRKELEYIKETEERRIKTGWYDFNSPSSLELTANKMQGNTK